MNYISVEEFLKQPKEIQKVFLNWWNPEVGDIYCNLYNGQQNNVLVINECQFHFYSFKDDVKKYGIPLLTEGQLRQFIEEQLCGLTYIIKPNVLGYGYKIIDPLTEKTEAENEDLLLALWQVAVKLAEQKD